MSVLTRVQTNVAAQVDYVAPSVLANIFDLVKQGVMVETKKWLAEHADDVILSKGIKIFGFSLGTVTIHVHDISGFVIDLLT